MKMTISLQPAKQLIYLSAFLFIGILSSCNPGEESETDLPEKELTFDQRIYNQIKATLSIPSSEKFTWKTYKAHMNADNFEDAVIAINLKEYAKKQAADPKVGRAIAEAGYFGNYNYFIFYDGKLDKLSYPVSVASNAMVPLKIQFENIISETYKDLTIEYRMSHSAYKSYYTLSGQTLQQVFDIKMYDSIGYEKPEVYFFEYGRGSISYAKDILVYRGEIKDYSPDVKDFANYNPVILKKDKLVYRWFYNPQIMKYMTDPSKVNK